MTKEEFLALYEKYTAGQCSVEETRTLMQYKDEFELKKLPWSTDMGNRDEIKVLLLHQLRTQIQADVPKSGSAFKKLAIAASLLITLSIGFFFLPDYKKKQSNKQQRFAKQLLPQPVISPGGNKAILILANGNMVNLDGTDKGIVSTQGTAQVTKLSNGKLVYKETSQTSNKTLVAYNTIATPRGGQYQLTLTDGTKVWLNAASSLKFPTTFSGAERLVELTGEAYFEVAKNKSMPFKVMAKGVNVNVLGTHFNVMAYQDESTVQTTLLEGAVRLTKDDAEATLIPGEQGMINTNGQNFTVKHVKVEDVVSWKDGSFNFENENIKTIMRQVSRWYDVDIAYEGTLAKQNFGGSVSKFKDISFLLKTLELTGTVHFKTDGRRITVMP
ncbi:FecR domain-containing protein [Mucilaginibacter sp. CSA2-8R]|uniref:FecR family protein n=1 Tax=Mucilaginibacter sp. CSA2-8R TaxID=3141542 RepID=UPI00315C5A87